MTIFTYFFAIHFNCNFKTGISTKLPPFRIKTNCNFKCTSLPSPSCIFINCHVFPKTKCLISRKCRKVYCKVNCHFIIVVVMWMKDIVFLTGLYYVYLKSSISANINPWSFPETVSSLISLFI